MQGASDKFPEGVKIGKLSLRRIVEMGRSIVHVCRKPHDILDRVVLDEAEQVCQLKLTPKGWSIAISPGLKSQNIRDLQTKGHVTGDHLPGRSRVEQGAFQPLHLRWAQKGRLRAGEFLP